MDDQYTKPARRSAYKFKLFIPLFLLLGLAAAVWVLRRNHALNYQPRVDVDEGGFLVVTDYAKPWDPEASLDEIAQSFDRVGYRLVDEIDKQLKVATSLTAENKVLAQMDQVSLLNYEGETRKAYELLGRMRSVVESDPKLRESLLYSLIYVQGVTALRLGENDNCILCRGESSCILPISAKAVHTNPEGSRAAIKHFLEYLAQFPNDEDVRWLLNVAHMTLGEHPDKVDPRYLVSIDKFVKSEFDIGKFRDIGAQTKLNKLNQAGGGIMEDFDNDGLLDIVVTSFNPTEPMTYFHNTGKGDFEDASKSAGITDQLGGLNCVQTDYNNDGLADIFIVRGAWLLQHMATRPTLLCNLGKGVFRDVTSEAGLITAVNSISSSWADYDNDGWLDVFVCCERQSSRLYHNLQNGKFEEVAVAAGVSDADRGFCKAAAWLDFDNDGFQDLFLNYIDDYGPRLFRNNRQRSFRDVTREMGIDGPQEGFSCWSWDFNNDGWLDIFATSYSRTVADVARGLQGLSTNARTGRLFLNEEGRRFRNVTKQAGLDGVYSTMGSNFADFDNDGFLDFYLGTGDPHLSTLVPNRMFKNVAGARFSEITGSAHVGNLQKGHGVACGDWDRNGSVDLFIEMGGAIVGDRYHNILFQNPGNNHHWITIKLVGEKSNRPAIGARIKIITDSNPPLVIHRQISTGSSFGANPFQQTIGLADSKKIAQLEITWPASGTTQTFRDVPVDQAVLIPELATEYQQLDWQPIPLPKDAE